MKPLTTLIFLVTFIAATLSPEQASAQKKKRAGNGPMQAVSDVEGLPRVLLIGDSISIGYTVAVRELMKGKANVHRPLTNCGPTTKGLAQIEAWLKTGGEDKKWDVIHFNWGLHDLKYMGKDGSNLADPDSKDSHQQVPPAEYEKNLRQLVERLEKTEAKLIWRNTTPVPKGSKGRVTGDSLKYNQIAARIMKEKGIPTDDLYTFSLERQEQIQRPANVHFTPEGSKALAVEVVKIIEKVMQEK